MKKTVIVALMLGFGLAVNAQKKSAPKEPPPPPPKIEVQQADPPPPPPPPMPPSVKPPRSSAPPPAPLVKEIPAAPPVVEELEIVPLEDKTAGSDFFQRNQEVKSIHQNNDLVTITKKDGSKENFDLSKKEEATAFKAKYGEMPPAPPPPAAPRIKTKKHND